MASKDQVIANFAKQTGKHTKGSVCNGGGWGGGGHSGYNLFYEGQILYSFGHHFPLCIRHQDTDVKGSDGFGCGVMYIINGDRYSVTTTKHQNQVIRECKPNVQIPFSALQKAWNWAQGPESTIGQRIRYADDLARRLESGTSSFRVIAWNKDEWTYQGVDEDGKPLTGWMTQEEMNTHRDNMYEIRKDCPCAEHRSRHRLGAVLFTIRNQYFLSSFDEQDRSNYFLCQVPGEPKTVEEAYENLKPKEIKWVEGLNPRPPILRQGDWFFIPSLDQNMKNTKQSEQKAIRLGGNSGTHMVTRSRILAGCDPLIVVSGIVRHSPTDGRSPEHKRLKLGDGKSWWIPVKNTSEAGWGARGNVD